MNKQRVRLATAGIVALALIGAACGSDDDDSGSASSDVPAGSEAPAGTDAPAGTEAPAGTDAPAGSEAPAGTAGGDCAEPEPISLQLQWFTQAQFAGYFAALEKG